MSIVKAENAGIAKYEEVLIRRDNLKKEAEAYQLLFVREFGDLIRESFELKIECIRKKKMIAYCQMQANQGKGIKQSDLTAFIEKEMLEYRKELERMIEEIETAKKARKVSENDVLKIKKIYYALVKLIHPDMHPELANDETIKDLWNRIVIAYSHNMLKDLEELDLLARKYLKDSGLDSPELNVDDIDEKIAAAEDEIARIISTNPYLYKLLLSDAGEVERKKQEYADEIESYRNYSEQLEEVLSAFEIKEMLS